MDDTHEVDSYTTDHHQCTSHCDAACEGHECSLLSGCRSVSRSLASTERSSIMGRVTTLWSKYAVALNDIEHVQIDSHMIAKCDSSRRRSIVAYVMDVYVAMADLGLHDHWTTRQPHYQVQHRYSDCRALRLALVSRLLDAHCDQSCEFCSCMLSFITSQQFPKRWPSALVQLVPGWQALLIRCRKQGLQNWVNRLLFTARHLTARGSASLRCDGYSAVMYILKDFLLEPSTRQSVQR